MNKVIKKISELRAIEILNRAPLFKGLTPDEKKLIARIPDLFQVIPQNVKFIRAGDHEYCIYVLLAGRAAVSKNDMILGHIEGGDFVGEVSFVTHEPRTASVLSLDELIVLRIDSDNFRKLPLRMREVVKDQIIHGLQLRVQGLNNELMKYRARDMEEAAKQAELEQEAEEPDTHAETDQPEDESDTSK